MAYAECEKMYSNSSPSMSLALPRNHRLTEKGPEAPAPVAHTSSQAVPSQAMHRALCGQEDCLHCRPQPATPVAGIVAKPLVSRGKLPRCLRTRALMRCTSKQTFQAEPQRAALAAAVAGELQTDEKAPNAPAPAAHLCSACVHLVQGQHVTFYTFLWQQYVQRCALRLPPQSGCAERIRIACSLQLLQSVQVRRC